MMQCEICLRPPSDRLPFNCTLCAREALYEQRIQLAQTLLQNETATQDVESHLGGKRLTAGTAIVPPTTNKSQEDHGTWALDRARAEQSSSKEKTQDILNHVEALRNATATMKAEITKRKVQLLQRKADLKTATDELSRREAVALGPAEDGVRRIEHRWEAMHRKTVESRVFLCREAAHLYGLQQRKAKRVGRDIYLIGGVPIADLRDLNDASPAQVTTSTTNLAHLIHLVSHYLALRLPAEITLPHRDYPLPTIFPPHSSYGGREVPYPGLTPSQSSSNSPSASRIADHKSLPRPRPLYLDRKLTSLAKEDPVAYALFVEGITLLAWDIAWVCRTQGLHVGAASWEEVCAMGRNLWQLLLAGLSPFPIPTSAPKSHPSSSRDVPSRTLPSRAPTSLEATAASDAAALSARLGHFSHGTAHSFLAAAEGTEYMRDWRLQSPVHVVEKVKGMLLSERTGAEWELLEGNEWEEEPLIGGEDGKERHGPEARVEEDEVQGKGVRGWMKVKSRGST